MVDELTIHELSEADKGIQPGSEDLRRHRRILPQQHALELLDCHLHEQRSGSCAVRIWSLNTAD